MSIIDLMVAVLDDKSDGLPSLEKSIITLMGANFDKAQINEHVEKAHGKQFALNAGNGRFRSDQP